jgi:hypothetical protein
MASMVGSASLVASTLERWREEAKGYLAEHRPDIPSMDVGWMAGYQRPGRCAEAR